MTGKKTIIFHGLAHARAALAAAREHNAALALKTAPGAAAYAGVGYLKAIVEKAGADKAGVEAGVEAIIDCGEDAVIALAALRTGWKLVEFSGSGEVFAKLAQIAGQQHARVLEPDPDRATLDLLDAPDALAACRNFLGSAQ